MTNEPYYIYLEWYLYKLVNRYNKGEHNLYNDIMQVCKEHNADSKLEHQNRNETYYPFIEIVHRNPNKPMKAVKNWSCL